MKMFWGFVDFLIYSVYRVRSSFVKITQMVVQKGVLLQCCYEKQQKYRVNTREKLGKCRENPVSLNNYWQKMNVPYMVGNLSG